jgi:hypothetical protein
MELAPVILEKGEVFGKLTVLTRVKAKTPEGLWRCGCECGFAGVLARTSELMKGKVKSCRRCNGRE